MANTTLNLDRLKKLVDDAVVATRTPPTPDAESWPMTLPQHHFDRETWKLLWDVVAWIRRNRRDVYKQFLFDREIADLVVEMLAAAAVAPSVDAIVERLTEVAEDKREWIVAVPIANMKSAAPWLKLGPRAGLLEGLTERDWTPWGSEERAGPFDAFNHLGDRLTPRPRWLRSEALGGEIDTRNELELLSVEQGTEYVARSVAESRANYALASWCLLAPPGDRELWPTIGTWSPHPFIEFGTIRKVYEPGKWTGGSSRRGALIVEHGAYALPQDEELVATPFKAMALLGQRHCAQALLSAAWALYLAARVPSELERTDRLLHVYVALEALCEDPADSGRGVTHRRWEDVSARMGVWQRLVDDGYDPEDVEEARSNLRAIRNLATHTSDTVLMNLNCYPEGAERVMWGGIRLGADDLALAVMTADFPVMYRAVRDAACALFRGAIDRDWDDDWFHSQFAPAS